MPAEPALGGIESLDELRSRTDEGMPGPESVACPGDSEQLMVAGGSLRKTLAVEDRNAFVVFPVHDQPGSTADPGGGEDVQILGMRFQVFEKAEPKGELLAGARIDHRELAVAPPILFLLRRVAVESRDRRPGDQRAYPLSPWAPGRREDSVATAAAVAEEAEPGRIDPTGSDLLARGFEDRQQIGDLAAMGVGPKGGGIGHQIVPRQPARSGEVEADDDESAVGQ